jgi:hypothetical protein
MAKTRLVNTSRHRKSVHKNGWFRFDDVGAGVPLRFNSFEPMTGATSHATAQTDNGSLTVLDLVIGAATGRVHARVAPSG